MRADQKLRIREHKYETRIVASWWSLELTAGYILAVAQV